MILYIAASILLALIIAAVITNPFSRLTIVRKPFVARWANQTIKATNNNHRMLVRNNWWWVAFAWVKMGINVMETRYIKSPRSKGKTIPAITKDIHELRYNTNKLLLISGDHFSPLFVRNLGVFFYPLLDDRIASSEKDWQNRQIVYLETTAFALGAFNKYKGLTTTIVPTSPNAVTCVNFYAYPSDSLYGILYALAVMSGLESPRSQDYGYSQHKLQSQDAASTLVGEYRKSLKKLYANYRKTVYNASTGLIRKDVHLSGAKDITRRYCAFYDNVIYWKTTDLAMKLNLIPENIKFLKEYKQRIIDTFWLKNEGYFLEDLSDESIELKHYSSDWLAVLFTGFLDPTKKSDHKYFTRSLDYIEKQGIDQPFAIKYQQERRAHRQFLAVRLAVAQYGGDSIWSFWGMEYIKTLVLLHKSTGNKKYLEKADYHIAKYKAAMLRDGGFPEVYDSNGKMLQTPLYRSIRQTGWVIGFEQALAMRAEIS